MTKYQEKVKSIIFDMLTNDNNITIYAQYKVGSGYLLDLFEKIAIKISEFDQEVMDLNESKDFTMDEACKIIVDLWGINARCWTEKGYPPFSVGLGGIGREHIVRGKGNTWLEALADAGIIFMGNKWMEGVLDEN